MHHNQAPEGPRLTLGSIKNRVVAEANKRGWQHTGEGKPQHPYRYYKTASGPTVPVGSSSSWDPQGFESDDDPTGSLGDPC